MLRKILTFIVGAVVLIPSLAFAYNVKQGDTLSQIAVNFGTTLQELLELNPEIKNPDFIKAGQEIATDDNLGLALPTDNYDSFLTSPLSASTSTIFVNAIPTGVTETIYTIFATDGTTPREKVYCTGTASSPNKLTGCVRGISFSPSSGTITETAGTGLSHSKNARIAITDNINFSGKALSILSGYQKTSSTDFIIGTGASTTINVFFANTASTSTAARVLFRGGFLGWTDDGSSFYRFVDGGSGLAASSTKGIGITDSKIHVNASSTGGLEFNSSDGYLQVKASSTKGIATDTNGTYVDTTDSLSWTAPQTFTTTTIATSTISSTTISNTLNLRGYDTRTLVGNSSSSLHFHPSTSTVFSTTTANYTGSFPILHSLGAAPRRIDMIVTGAKDIVGNDVRFISHGVWTDMNGTGTGTQNCVYEGEHNDAAGGNDDAYTNGLCATGNISTNNANNTDFSITSVSATSVTISMDADGGGSYTALATKVLMTLSL